MEFELLLLLLYNIYIAHYITITLSASHYKTIKIIQDTNWYEVKVKTKQNADSIKNHKIKIKSFRKEHYRLKILNTLENY